VIDQGIIWTGGKSEDVAIGGRAGNVERKFLRKKAKILKDEMLRRSIDVNEENSAISRNGSVC